MLIIYVKNIVPKMSSKMSKLFQFFALRFSKSSAEVVTLKINTIYPARDTPFLQV